MSDTPAVEDHCAVECERCAPPWVLASFRCTCSACVQVLSGYASRRGTADCRCCLCARRMSDAARAADRERLAAIFEAAAC